MATKQIALHLPDEGATMQLGEDIAACFQAGDVVALSGGLGAGKTTLARAMIRTLCGDPDLEVPSPTFTLVQSYSARFPVVHADLYRLSSASDLDELGLDDEARGGVLLVEWPENADGILAKQATLAISLTQDGDGRDVLLEGGDAVIMRLERSLAIRAFLEKAGHQRSRRSHLLGDASARSYERIIPPDGAGLILMNAPAQPDGPPVRDGKPYSRIAHLAETVTPFVAIDVGLREAGFAAPEILARDLDLGLLLLEDLGAAPFLHNGSPVEDRYLAAARLLAELHQHKWPKEIEVGDGIKYRVPEYDRQAQLIEVELLIDWYLPSVSGEPASNDQRGRYIDAWNNVLDQLTDAEHSLVLRDFHSPNIVWRENRKGNDRLGLIDFQDAVFGPAAYDVASLAQDARVTINSNLEQAVVAAYCQARSGSEGFDGDRFMRDYAIMSVQRNSKILGIFVRLDQRDGKPGYLKHLPRIRQYVAQSMAHEALAPLRPFYAKLGLVDG